MIDIDALKASGYSQDVLKEKFQKDPPDEKIKKLCDQVYAHIKDGVTYNIKQSRLYYALDLAWNSPFRQTTPTLLHSLKGKDSDDKTVQSALQDWGASWMIDEINSLKGEQPKKLNIPEFFSIFVPLVRSYVTVRWARIVNDRRLVPFFKYEPVKNSKKNRAQCEVVTDRVERISVGYDYQSVFQHSVFHCLHYGQSLMFPRESWHSECQEKASKKSDKYEEVIVKEGLRYHIPHPTRTFYDLNYPLYTINTSTGCAWAGYWGINKWGEINGCGDYYNLDKVSYGGVDWLTGATGWTNFLATVMGGTALNFPTPTSITQDVNVQLDRETQASLYSSNDHDKSVVVSECFELINPKEAGLYDYDYKVWHRFVVANATTILYCEPLPYVPVVFFGYDTTGNHAIHSSLSLEVLPFQDHFGNLLSQYILAVKQNLANITFVDSTQANNSVLERIRNMGRRLYEALNFETYDSRQSRVAQKEIKEVFQSFTFPRSNTQEIAEAMRQLLDILERVLVLSSQEVGAAGSHEQTAEEIRNIASFTSNRLQFTANAFDRGMNAWKRQVYEGLMAFGEPELYATLQNPISKDELEKLGFTVESHDNDSVGYAVVKIDKSAIELDEFAANRDTGDRVNNTAGASAMTQALGIAIGNPMTAAAIGAEQALEALNYIGEMAGVPRDFRLKISAQYAEYEKLQKQAAQSQQEAANVGPMLQKLQEEMGGALQQLAAQTQQQIAALAQQQQALAQGTAEVLKGQVQPAVEQATQMAGQALQGTQAVAGQLEAQAQLLDRLGSAVAAVSTLVSQPPPQGGAPTPLPMSPASPVPVA